MSGSLGGVELLSIIRSSLDASGYVAGARQAEGANDGAELRPLAA